MFSIFDNKKSIFNVYLHACFKVLTGDQIFSYKSVKFFVEMWGFL